MAGNAQLYRADLDRNGIQDLVIWRGISGNGLAPNAFLILMTFNQQGRPCVFQSDSFYTASETGIDDLLDLQRNGKLVLKPIAGRDPQSEDLALTQRCLIKGDVLDGVNQL